MKRLGFNLIVLLLLFIVVLVSLFVTDRISFSPIGTASAAEIIGCNNYQQDPQGRPPPPQEPPYGNCVIDGLVLLNEIEYPDVNGTYLRAEMISRMQEKGYPVPRRGLNWYGQKDAEEIKKKIMSELGYTETIGTGKGNGPAFPINPSPFKNNCPFIGTWISFGGGGHSSACLVLDCDRRTGAATLECLNSPHAPPPVPGGNRPFKVGVSSSGRISTPGLSSSWDGTQAGYWSQVNYPG